MFREPNNVEDYLLPELEARHLRVLEDPMSILRRELDPSSVYYPLTYSRDRGSLPVLINNISDIDDVPVVVLANSGAQLQNSAHFPLRHVRRVSREIIRRNTIAAGPSVLAYTKPQDEFVFQTDDDEAAIRLLNIIVDSFSTVGIGLTRQFYPVDSIEDWIETNAGKAPILPHVFEPSLVRAFGESDEVKKRMLDSAFAGIAAYTKNGIQQLWQAKGVPTPKTRYFDLSKVSLESADEEIRKAFRGYSECVVSIFDGSGGYGIVFAPIDNMYFHLGGSFGNKRIQVQGVLPIIASPCCVANISPSDIEILLVSKQRFSQPGVYKGNLWHSSYSEELARQVLDFADVNFLALEVLRRAGIIGQVNIDSLTLSDDDAKGYKTATTLM